jgi:3-methyladenine DNA glycosylase AlkD
VEPGPAELRLRDLVVAFRAAGDPERAGPMAAYMKDRFRFFGIPSPARRSIQRTVLGRWRPEPHELVAFTDAAFTYDEREVQYAACDLVSTRGRDGPPALIDDLARWITTKSWWDTVDTFARPTGDLVRAHPELGAVMDEWVDADDFWLARIAILHQLHAKADTDPDRLFSYCERRAGDREFFIRKAIGWALREYAKTDPDAVRTFVAAHTGDLSPLSQREALRRLAPSA